MDGKYYGNNHTISGIYINNSSDYQGLFGSCSTAEIKDLGIINSYIKGKEYVGGIVGDINGDYKNHQYISNCYNKAIVKGDSSDVGGIIGEGSYLNIDNCYNSGYVSNTSGYVGGIIGDMMSANITNSYNAGTVESTSSSVGGIVGTYMVHTVDPNLIISNCYNSGTVKGKSVVGGIAGGAGSSSGSQRLIKSYNIGSVTGTDEIGGIAGRNNSNIQECYNAGEVSGDTSVGGITGIHGHQTARTQYAYNIGKVIGNNNVGGIIGVQYYGYMYYSYNVGEVIANRADSAAVGGIAGRFGANSTSYSAYIYNCYNLSSSIKTFDSGSWTYCGGIVGETGYYAYLNNCYNSGNMNNSIAQYKGGIARKHILL